MNKNIKLMFLFLTLLIFLVGVVNASDSSSNDTTTEIEATSTTQEASTTTQIEKTSNELQTNDNKESDVKIEKNIKKVKTNDKSLKTDLNSKSKSYITINNLTATTYGSTKTITGKLKTDDIYLINTPVILYVNGVKKSTANTTNEGTFTFKYKTTIVGTNNITVKYNGNKSILPKNVTKKLTVNKDPLKITVNNISQKTYKDNVKITGKFTNSRGEAIKNTNLKINVNGKTYNVKSTNNGTYTKNIIANNIGTNNITVSYAGNKNFIGATAKTTFKTTACPTKITANNIPQKTYKDKFTVNGKFTDNKSNAITNTIVKINLNGKTYNAKTDNNGYYTKTITANKVGSNTLTVSYAGNTKFKAASIKKTFTTIARPTKINCTVNNVNYSDYASIKGYLTDNNNNKLKNTKVIVNINGAQYNTKTDNNGKFNYSYKTKKAGKNNITVSFNGTENYRPVSKSTTFTVYKIEPIVYVDYIPDIVLGESITITGSIFDPDEKPINNFNITIKINNTKHNVKTNSNGIFSYTFKPTQLGKLPITISLTGNENYNSSSDGGYIEVLKAYNMTLNFIKNNIDEKIVNDNVFYTFYTYENDEIDPGAYVVVEDLYSEKELPDYLIINATFYFKNSKGKIIAKEFSMGDGFSIYHEMISGYTPQKVTFTYRKLTDSEKSLYNEGYEYIAETKEWIPEDELYDESYESYTDSIVG